MSDDGVYRRVRNSNPMFEELARQVCDEVERRTAAGRSVVFIDVARLCALHGAPLEYVFAEQERRVRARRTPEKNEG